MSNDEVLDQILAQAERTYSTKEAVALLDRSEPWAYWVLAQKTLIREDGTPIIPETLPSGKRMRFSLLLLKEIAISQYRRGNYSDEEMSKVSKRIAIAARGGDWVEEERLEEERQQAESDGVSTDA